MLQNDETRACIDRNRLLDRHAELCRSVKDDESDFLAWHELSAIEAMLGDGEAADTCSHNARIAAHNMLGHAADLVRSDQPKQALSLTQTLADHRNVLRALDIDLAISLAQNRGAAFVEDGDPRAAETEFLTALRLLRVHCPRDHAAIGRVLQMASAAAFARDDRKHAARRLRAARQAFGKGAPTPEDLLQLSLSEGTLSFEIGDWALAAGALRKAAALALECDNPEIAAHAHGQHALAALRMRDYQSARASFERALAIARSKGGALLQTIAAWAGEYDLALGERLPDQAHLENALTLLGEAEASHQPVLTRIYATRGAVLLALGRNEEALDALLRAFWDYRNQLAPQLLSQAYVAGHIAGALANLGAFERALLWARKAERAKRSLIGKHHPSRLSGLVTIAALLSALQRMDEALALLESVVAMESESLARIIESDRGAVDATRQRLALEAFHAYAAIVSGAPTRINTDAKVLDYYLASIGLARRLRAASPKGASSTPAWKRLSQTSLLGMIVAVRLFDIARGSGTRPWSIGWSAPKSAVFVRNGEHTQRLDGASVEALKAELSIWRNAVRFGWSGDPPPQLKRLLDDTFAALGPCSGLALVASDFFHAIPLSVYRPDAIIVELEADFDTGRDAQTHGSNDVLIVIAEDFAELTEGAWRLPAEVADEVQHATGDATATILLADNANPDNVLGALNRHPRRVHFIAHGYAATTPGAQPDPFQSAALLLSGGILDAAMIGALNLDGVELVVLSACSTALGEPIESEGSASLASTILEAGARAVLASLWPVGTNATSELMSVFYRALPKLGAARALVEAQKTLRLNGYSSREWAGWRLFARGPITAEALLREAI